MTTFGAYPTPITKFGVTQGVKQAINSACQSIYGDKTFKSQVIAYRYGSLLMYSVSASSKAEIDAADINFDAMKTLLSGNLPELSLKDIDIALGSIDYLAPSSAKFLIILHT